MNNLEVQFHAALLECGDVPRLKMALSFERDGRGISPAAQFNYPKFKTHKLALLEHLVRADYFDVFYDKTCKCEKMEAHLTEKAALWVGEFYQWLVIQQDVF